MNTTNQNNVDTTQTITHISLCAGYGGIDIGLGRAIPSLRTIAFSEIEAFACANLVAKMEAGLMDAAPIWTNLKTFPWDEFRGKVDILSGGYPCQPFSAAGKRLGEEDPRHLWPFIADGIVRMRPRICFFENVEGHISLGLSNVIEDLAGMGYRTTWGVFSASEVGAPHQRKRVFILAYDSSAGLQGNLAQLLNTQGWQESCGSVGSSCGFGGAGDLANANCAGGWEDWQSSQSWAACIEQPSSNSRRGEPREIREGQAWPSRPSELADPCNSADTAKGYAEAHRLPSEYRKAICARVTGGTNATAWPSRPGEPQHGWEPPRVVVDTKSQRAGQRSELRSEECGSRGALPREFEQSGEGDVANDHRPHAGHGEQRPERELGDLSGGCGEAMGNADPRRLASGIDAGSGTEADRGGQGHIEQADCRAMGNASGQRCEQDSTLRSQLQSSRASEECGTGVTEAMGNTNSPRPQERQGQRGEGIQGTHADGGEDAGGQAQPSLGGDADGAAGGLGYAELSEPDHAAGREESESGYRELAHSINNGCYNANSRPDSNGEQGALGETTETETRRDRIHSSQHGEVKRNGSLYISCDNRTDELRLLGNGVVPATAERAFRVLMTELTEL